MYVHVTMYCVTRMHVHNLVQVFSLIFQQMHTIYFITFINVTLIRAFLARTNVCNLN